MLRLPDGMRERIKVKAERADMSMNEAIVWCLEHFFPAPKPLEAKIEELAEMVAILKGDDTYKAVGDLTAQIHDALIDIGGKDVIGPVDFKKMVTKRFEQWQEWEAENWRDLNENPFDDANYPDIGGIPFEEVDFDAPVDPKYPLAVQRKKKKDE